MRKGEPAGRTPRCRASPFRTAPIPCSRTPKWILRAPQLPAATSPPFLKARFVEVARSADPPTSSGSLGAMACSTFPDAARVAWASAGGGGGGVGRGAGWGRGESLGGAGSFKKKKKRKRQ